ncbi:MAG: hypothetical protein GXP24_05070 [Planctomycetes bacterium]|nr:hypothetical protein [Planctomycetota bacterium]
MTKYGASETLEDNRLEIRVTEETVTTRRRRSGPPWLMLGGGLLVLAGGGIVLFSGDDKPPAPQPQATVPGNPVPEVVEPLVQESTFADDGQSMWVSPTEGKPIDLGYLLPGTQLVLHIRVAELLAHAEGEKVLAALGPWGEQIVEQLTRSTGVKLPEIETLLLGIRPSRKGTLDFALRLGLVQEKTQAELGEPLPVRSEVARFRPDQSEGKVLVLCSAEVLSELESAAAQPPLFARELQRVLQRTDVSRMATLVFASKFLQINGEEFLSGAGEPLREALGDFLGEEATAIALSAHWDDNFFLELQSTVALNTRPHRLAALLEQRVAASSDQIEDVLLAEPPHPYGRKVLARFPAMLRKLGNYTRSDEVEGLSVLRCYLPVNAGHNLVMALELLLEGETSRDASVVLRRGDISSAEPSGLAERLQQSTSLVFPKETLQRALEILSEDLGVPLEIAGRDLQLEGITKNQSFEIDLQDQPGAEILLAVLLRANPDRTASGPTDVKQKLVYVLRQGEIKGEGDQPSVIVVTTRSAAARRGEKLPAVFEPTAR